MRVSIILFVISFWYSAEAQFGFPRAPQLKFPGSDLASKIVGNASLPGLSSLPKIPIITDLLKKEFGSFKDTFKKVYKTAEEETLRLNVFALNKEKISDFNKLFKEGVVGFTQKVNSFSDLLHDEFVKQFNGYGKNLHPATKKVPAAETFKPKSTKVPEHVDWREKGAISSVKSQGNCSACWAFAAAGALEAYNYLKSGKLNELSVQNLIDCTTPYGTSGCLGGLMNPAFEYVKENKGIVAAGTYEYEEKNGECRFKPDSGIAATCKGFVDIPENDEKAIEMAVATEGPVTVAINAGVETFQFYDDGIYDDPECDNKLDHAVLIVGYGVESDGRKYWIVKNSYGPDWGKDGYFKISRGNNRCGLAVQASYPIV